MSIIGWVAICWLCLFFAALVLLSLFIVPQIIQDRRKKKVRENNE